MGDPEVVREIFMLDATQAATAKQWNSAGYGGEHSILLLDGNPTSASGNSDAALPRRSPAGLWASVTSLDRSALSGSQVIDCGPSTDARTHLGVILQAVFGLREGGAIVRAARLMSTMLDSLAHPISASLFFPALQKDWGAGASGADFYAYEHSAAAVYAEIRDRRQYWNNQGAQPKRPIFWTSCQR